MSEIEVLELVLRQMGELRIPLREKELREQLMIIGQNIEAVRDAIVQARGTAGADAGAFGEGLGENGGVPETAEGQEGGAGDELQG